MEQETIYNKHIASFSVSFLWLASLEPNNKNFLFAITAAGVVLCGGPKKSPRTSSIVQRF